MTFYRAWKLCAYGHPIISQAKQHLLLALVNGPESKMINLYD